MSRRKVGGAEGEKEGLGGHDCKCYEISGARNFVQRVRESDQQWGSTAKKMKRRMVGDITGNILRGKHLYKQINLRTQTPAAYLKWVAYPYLWDIT